MSDRCISVLIVDGDAVGEERLRGALAGCGGAAEVRRIAGLAEATGDLARRATDVVLLDLQHLAGQQGPAIACVRAVAPDVPIVLLGDADDAIAAGASDLVRRHEGEFALARALRHAIVTKRASAAKGSVIERLQRVADNVPALVAYVDSAERYTFKNRSYDECFSQWGAVLGRTVRDVIGVALYDEVRSRLERALSGELVTFEIDLPIQGEMRPSRVRYVPDHATSGEVRGVFVIIVDISDQLHFTEERERLIESEQRARDEVARATRIKDEFLSTISHELRTPLHAILGWAQLLQRNGGKDVMRGIEVIERNARAQAKLVDELLDMSRIVSGKIRLDAWRMFVLPPVEAAIEAAAPAAQAKGVRIIKIFDALAGPVRGDVARIQQIAWHLVSNAVKFTPKGGEVTVELTRAPESVVLRVSDNGFGIDAAALPYIFDRFRQVDGSAARRFGGLGLGLTVVKQLVEMHGGAIEARSEGVGRGATFEVVLPLHASSDADAAGEAPRDSWADPEAAAPSLLGLDVLVVDDEIDGRDVVRRILEEHHAEVRTAGSALEALAMMGERRPDVLVSDIGMPEIDGYELIRRVRALPAADGGTTPAAALTAFARSDDRIWAMMSGFQTHLSKPVRAQALVAVVAGLAGRGGARGQASTPAAPAGE